MKGKGGDLRGEMLRGEDTAGAGLCGEICHFGAAVLPLETLVAEANVGLFVFGGTAYGHAEALLTISRL